MRWARLSRHLQSHDSLKRLRTFIPHCSAAVLVSALLSAINVSHCWLVSALLSAINVSHCSALLVLIWIVPLIRIVLGLCRGCFAPSH